MSVSDEEFLNHAIYMAESLLDGVNKRSKETGQCLDKWTVVIDAEGFSVKQMTKNVLERQKIITKIFEGKPRYFSFNVFHLSLCLITRQAIYRPKVCLEKKFK